MGPQSSVRPSLIHHDFDINRGTAGVVSHRFWTSSGVTAGIDMAAAFIRHLVSLQVPPDQVGAITHELLGILEVT